MARDLDLLLEDILSAARDGMRYATGLSEVEFRDLPKSDRDTFRALKNALAEMGEAVKGMPGEIADRHPSTDWKGMAGLRDIVAHQYFRIDMARLWPVLTEELPVLVEAVESELSILRQSERKDRYGI